MAGPVTYARLARNKEATARYFRELEGHSLDDPLEHLRHDEVWARNFVGAYYRQVNIRGSEGTDAEDKLGSKLPQRDKMPVSLAPLQNVVGTAERLARAILEEYQYAPEKGQQELELGYHWQTKVQPSLSLLQSGDHSAIATGASIDTIIEHFGKDSPEVHAHEMLQADQLRSRAGSSYAQKQAWASYVKDRVVVNGYQVPQRTESPFGHAGVLKRWIADFCDVNGLKKPDGFWKKEFKPIHGMGRGMLSAYGFNEKAIYARAKRVPESQYVTTPQKEPTAKTPPPHSPDDLVNRHDRRRPEEPQRRGGPQRSPRSESKGTAGQAEFVFSK